MTDLKTKLPKAAPGYLAAIISQANAAMRSVAHKGIVRGGRRGKGNRPNFQVECPDGTIIRYRAVEGEAKFGRIGVSFSAKNLSDPLNDAMLAAVP